MDSFHMDNSTAESLFAYIQQSVYRTLNSSPVARDVPKYLNSAVVLDNPVFSLKSKNYP